MTKILRSVSTFCFAAVAGLFLLGGCKDAADNIGEAKASGYSIPLPRRIQPHALPGECADNIRGSIQLDDQAPVLMDRQKPALLWSATLKSLPLGVHRFIVVFSCTSTAYGAITLARAEQQVELVAGPNNISFPESLFVYKELDDDADGVSNLAEMENGTNPLPSSDLELNPAITAVAPADGAVGLEPTAVINMTFKHSLEEDSIDENSIVVSFQGEEVKGSVRYDAQVNTIVFTPEKPLGLFTEYTVNFSKSVLTASGTPVADEDLRWTFKTRDGRWQTPKYVSGQPGSRSPAIAANEKGDAIVIWRKGSNQIWGRSFNGEQQLWEELNQVTDPEELSTAVTDITVSLSDRGMAVAAWSGFGGRSTIYKTCSSGTKSLGKWESLDCFDELGRDPDVEILSKGGAVIVWHKYPANQPMTGVPFGNIASGFLDPTWTFLGWQGVTQVENSIHTTATYPVLAVDGQEAATAVWLVQDSQNSNIFANRFINHQWANEPVKLSAASFPWDSYDSGDFYENRPKVAANKEGNVFAAWMQSNSGVWTRQFDANSSEWAEAIKIYSGAVGIRGVSIDMDQAGNAHLIWHYQNRIYAKRYSVFWQQWSKVETITDEADVDIDNPELKVDAFGNAIVVWTQYRSTSRKHGDILASRYKAGDTQWGKPVVIDKQTESATRHGISMLKRGEAFVVWESGGEIYATQFK